MGLVFFRIFRTKTFHPNSRIHGFGLHLSTRLSIGIAGYNAAADAALAAPAWRSAVQVLQAAARQGLEGSLVTLGTAMKAEGVLADFGWWMILCPWSLLTLTFWEITYLSKYCRCHVPWALESMEPCASSLLFVSVYQLSLPMATGWPPPIQGMGGTWSHLLWTMEDMLHRSLTPGIRHSNEAVKSCGGDSWHISLCVLEWTTMRMVEVTEFTSSLLVNQLKQKLGLDFGEIVLEIQEPFEAPHKTWQGFCFPKKSGHLTTRDLGSVTWFYGQVRNWTLAVQLFGDLERQRLEHDTVSVNSVLNAASQQRRYSKNLLEQLTFLLCFRLKTFVFFFRFPILALINKGFTSYREILGLLWR